MPPLQGVATPVSVIGKSKEEVEASEEDAFTDKVFGVAEGALGFLGERYKECEAHEIMAALSLLYAFFAVSQGFDVPRVLNILLEDIEAFREKEEGTELTLVPPINSGGGGEVLH